MKAVFFIFALLLPLIGRPEDKPKLENLKTVEPYHKTISHGWKKLNVSIDKFFSTEGFEEDINKSYILFSLGGKVADGKGFSSDYDLRLQTDFPNAKKDLNLVIQKEKEELEGELDEETPNVFDENTQENGGKKGVSAAGRFRFVSENKWNSFFDAGLKFAVPLDPFLKLRIKRRSNWSGGRFDVIQKFKYFRIEKLEHQTKFDLLFKLPGPWKIKFLNAFSYQRSNRFYSFYSRFSFLQTFSKRSSASYSARASGQSEPVYAYNNYSLSFSMRQLIHSDWIYLLPTVGVNFRRQEGFQRKGFFTLKLESFFR